MVECKLCNKEFNTVTNTHLKSVHDTTIDEYCKMFLGVELTSEETRQLLSESMSKAMTGEVRQAISDALLGHEGSKPSEEIRQQIAKALIGNKNALGHELSDETKRGISQKVSDIQRELWKDPEYAKHMSEAFLGHKGCVHTDESRRKISEALVGRVQSEETKQLRSETLKERWKESEFAQYMAEAQHRRPNGPELQLQSVLDKHFPSEWRYVGNNQFGVKGRYPDFVNVNGRKRVIEVFGYYWHDPILFSNRPTEEELIAHYKNYGFDCLVFWEYDVYDEDEVVRRIEESFGLVAQAK